MSENKHMVAFEAILRYDYKDAKQVVLHILRQRRWPNHPGLTIRHPEPLEKVFNKKDIVGP